MKSISRSLPPRLSPTSNRFDSNHEEFAVGGVRQFSLVNSQQRDDGELAWSPTTTCSW